MKEAYTIAISDSDSQSELKFSGNLIINHIEKIYAELKEKLTIDKPISVVIDNPENMDITFVQMLLSIKKACTEASKEFKVTTVLKDDLKQLIEKAGLNKELNI